MQDEGFHLPSQEAKAALNSATSLCKWFDSDQAKDMIEAEFNKALKTSLKECIQNAVQQGNGVDTQRLWPSYHHQHSEQIGHKQIGRCKNQQRILLNRTKSKVT